MVAASEWEHHWADLDGIRLHYVTQGEGHLLILLHGWPQTWFTWRKIMPALARQFRVVAPDLRGLGDSEKPTAGYDKRTVAGDIERLIEHLGRNSATVVGHDWGGPVAFRLALDHPKSVERLVIINARLPLTGDANFYRPEFVSERWYTFFHLVPELPERLVSGNVDAYIRYFLTHWAYRKEAFLEADIAEYVRAYSQPGALRAGFDYYRAHFDADRVQWQADRERTIDAPALVLWGWNDPTNPPEWTDGYPRFIPNLTIKFVRSCGHFMQEELPEVVVEEILKWIPLT